MSVEETLAEKLSKDELLRLVAVDKLIELYKDRNLVNVEEFCKSFDLIYKILQDGKTS